MSNNVRGIEHIGLTVPDIGSAERFFREAFGATVLYRLVRKSDDDLSGAEVGPVNSLPSDNAMRAVTMLRLGNGPNIELFEIAAPSRTDRGTIISDMGINHFSVYVEDIREAAEVALAAGATMLEGPSDGFGQESGSGNQVWFMKTPWGSLVELISLPRELAYDDGASQKRLIPLPR